MFRHRRLQPWSEGCSLSSPHLDHDSVRNAGKVLVVQQEGCHLAHGGLSNPHAGLQAGVTQGPPDKALLIQDSML